MFKKTFIISLTAFVYLLSPCFAQAYKAKNFDYLKGNLKEISGNQIAQHIKLYNGYVQKLNELDKKMTKVNKYSANSTYSEYRSVSSSRSFAHNGVLLHELYFKNLSAEKTVPSGELISKVVQSFGTFKNYYADLRAAAKSARSGWVISAYNPLDDKIHNYVIDEHDLHVPISIEPLLVLDMWEHAYMIDYGIDKKSYINKFILNINWVEVSKRYNEAVLKNIRLDIP